MCGHFCLCVSTFLQAKRGMRTLSYQSELIIPLISPGLNLILFISSICMIDEFAMVLGPG